MPGSRFDVAIIGSGLAGSTLAAVLARQGLAVLLLEAGSHPRFAVGESVVPEFGMRARLLAATYDVPELEGLATFQHLRHHVSANCGVKRNFTFLLHREGVDHRAEDTCQFETMTYPLGPDSHLWRPDVDAWLTALAVKKGATYRERSPVEDVAVDAVGVTVQAGGAEHAARFLVDASGHRSVLARREGLRMEPPDLATDSRTLFTHMVGVASVTAGRTARLPVPSPPDQGTLHHLFPGGWFWIIPFDNHQDAVNPVCSVGLTLDRRVHPDGGLPAEEEFRAFAARFPAVARQLAGARPVRSWVKTGRVQYRSTRVAGDRWCLLPHAANFVDPLFSGGLTMSLIGVHEVARVLLQSFADGRFAASRFAELEEGTHENVAVLDRLVAGAFRAMGSFPLFNAWFRIWAVGNYHGAAALIRLHLKHRASGDRRYLDQLHEKPFRRVLGMDHPRLRALLDDGWEIMERFAAGALDEAGAVDALYARLGSCDWIPPQFAITDRRRGHLASFTTFPLLSMILWGKQHAPPDMRNIYYDAGPVYFEELVRAFAREGRRSFGTFGRVLRDAHYGRARS